MTELRKMSLRQRYHKNHCEIPWNCPLTTNNLTWYVVSLPGECCKLCKSSFCLSKRMNEGEHLLYRSTNVFYLASPCMLKSSIWVQEGSTAGLGDTAGKG